MSGNNLVSGANAHNINTGAAYVFEKIGGTWSLEAKLTAAGGHVNDYFGSAVAIEDDWIVVGAYGVNLQVGSAYAFSRASGTWKQKKQFEPKLHGSPAPDADATNACFGVKGIALQNHTLMVGAAYVINKGAAYVFSDAV